MAEGSGDEGEDFEEIQATLCFVDPKPQDASGIAVFIPPYLHLNRQQVGFFIAKQTRVGTLIKDQNDDGSIGDSLFGISTCLNLAHAAQECTSIQEMIEWMKELNDPSLTPILISALPSVGFIIDERAAGVPVILAPHLVRGLFSEIQWATEDLETEEARNEFRFQYYIIPIKCTKEEGELCFSQVEHELYYNNAISKVEFDTEGEEGDLAEVEYHRYLLLLQADSINTVRQQLNAMFDIDESAYADEGKI